MVYENLIIFKKLVKRDSNEKLYYKKILLKILFFISLTFFTYKIILLLSCGTIDNIISSLNIIEKLFFPETHFLARQLKFSANKNLSHNI